MSFPIWQILWLNTKSEIIKILLVALSHAVAMTEDTIALWEENDQNVCCDSLITVSSSKLLTTVTGSLSERVKLEKQKTFSQKHCKSKANQKNVMCNLGMLYPQFYNEPKISLKVWFAPLLSIEQKTKSRYSLVLTQAAHDLFVVIAHDSIIFNIQCHCKM